MRAQEAGVVDSPSGQSVSDRIEGPWDQRDSEIDVVADETVDGEFKDLVVKRPSSKRVKDIEGVGRVRDNTQPPRESGGRDKIYCPGNGECLEEKDVVWWGIRGGECQRGVPRGQVDESKTS